MKELTILLISLTLFFCSPKGPQTYNSPFIGKTKTELIAAKGMAKEIKIFDNSEAYIYKVREEFFGNVKITNKSDTTLVPKKATLTEHIYYINEKGIVYKYQVWKKKVK